jgi:hypothetical protein
MPRVSNTADSTATPPASTSCRSGFNPGRRMRRISPASSSAWRSFCNPSAEITPSDQPLARRISETAPTVPLDPKASSHCAREKSAMASSNSAPAATCAFFSERGRCGHP